MDEYGCTIEEMEHVLKYSMTLLILPYGRYIDNSTQTDTGGGLVSEYLFVNTVKSQLGSHLIISGHLS